MICERVKEQIPEYLAGMLEEGTRERVLAHLDECVGCREEVTRLDIVWRKLETLPAPEPSVRMRERFGDVLAAYEYGRQVKRPPVDLRRWFSMPQWAAVSAAVVLTVSGAAVGRFTQPAKSNEYSQLKGEVESMRQLVTLSLMQQESPGARLRGVNYSYKMERPDPQVESALLYAVNHDANVNVRLSAMDALQRFADSAPVSRALIEALPTQDSPLVQIGLIDLLAGRNEPDAIPIFRKLTQDPQVDPAVRQRARTALNQLGAA